MSSNHLNRSLSKVEKGRSTAIVKWKLRVTFKFAMANGGQKRYGSADAIIIRRSDVEKVHDYARENRDLRDQLMIRLPMKIGLRTREIGTLTVEDINFEDRSFQVLDSKKHRFYPLPLDVLTLQLIKDLVKDAVQGLVFKHKNWKRKKQGQPLTNVSIWKTTKTIGEAAGVKGYNPRIGRHYFACDWHIVQHKSIEGLRRILRHKNLSVTHRYLARLVFFEDIQREYEETKNPYMVARVGFEPAPDLNRRALAARAGSRPNFYEEFCNHCIHEATCKFIEQMCSCSAVSGCRFYKQKKEMIVK